MIKFMFINMITDSIFIKKVSLIKNNELLSHDCKNLPVLDYAHTEICSFSLQSKKTSSAIDTCQSCLKCITNKRQGNHCQNRVCKIKYCSIHCKEFDLRRGHSLICMGVNGDYSNERNNLIKSFYDFRIQTYRVDDEIISKLHIFGLKYLSQSILSIVNQSKDNEKNNPGILKIKLTNILDNSKLKNFKVLQIDNSKNFNESFLESYLMMKGIYKYEKVYLRLLDYQCFHEILESDTAFNVSYINIGCLVDSVVTFQVWSDILHLLFFYSHRLSIHSSLHLSLKKLFSADQFTTTAVINDINSAFNLCLPTSISDFPDFPENNISSSMVNNEYIPSKFYSNEIDKYSYRRLFTASFKTDKNLSLEKIMQYERYIVLLSQLHDPTFSVPSLLPVISDFEIHKNDSSSSKWNSFLYEQICRLKMSLDLCIHSVNIIYMNNLYYTITHSCDPNVALEIDTTSHDNIYNEDVNSSVVVDIDKVMNSNLKINWIALKDIYKYDELTLKYTHNPHNYLSHINKNQNYHLSHKSITNICYCYKCIFSRNKQKSFIEFYQETLNVFSSCNIYWNVCDINKYDTNLDINDHKKTWCNNTNSQNILENNIKSINCSFSVIKWFSFFRQIKSLGDYAMQESDFTEAVNIYCHLLLCLNNIPNIFQSINNTILSNDNNNINNNIDTNSNSNTSVLLQSLKMCIGDVYHALGAALLDCNMNCNSPVNESNSSCKCTLWRKGHIIWRLGHYKMNHIFITNHKFLQEIYKKLSYLQYFTTPIENYSKISDQLQVITNNNHAINTDATNNSECKILLSLDNSNTPTPYYSNYFSKSIINSGIHDTDKNNFSSKSIHITRSPILTVDECNILIQSAEEYANRSGGSSNGWTTSRHYSVPTTDIPVYDLSDDVVAWFNQIIQTRIGPLIFQQYANSLQNISDLSNSTFNQNINNNNNIYKEWFKMTLHDAFIVKYHCAENDPHSIHSYIQKLSSGDGIINPNNISINSYSQRFLPLHIDQSTHSFVLPLNSSTSYLGGGTYFQDMNQSVKPRGSMYHGGDPVLQGTRYIIAAFLFLDRYILDEKEEMFETKITEKLLIAENKSDTIIQSNVTVRNSNDNTNINTENISVTSSLLLEYTEEDTFHEILFLKNILNQLHLCNYFEFEDNIYENNNTINFHKRTLNSDINHTTAEYNQGILNKSKRNRDQCNNSDNVNKNEEISSSFSFSFGFS